MEDGCHKDPVQQYEDLSDQAEVSETGKKPNDQPEATSVNRINESDEGNPDADDCSDELTEAEKSLHEAVKQGDYELVKSILTSHDGSTTLDINKKDSDNWSCLHEACVHTCQFNKIAELLLQNGADPNITDSSGETPLHGSVLFHYTDNVRLLCKYNADYSVCNNDGVSCLDIAEYAKDVEVLEIFGRKLPEKKGKKSGRKRGVGKRSVLRSRNADDMNYIPSPLSSPSILKKRKRTSDEGDDAEEKSVGPSPKKSITFSPKNRYTPSRLYR